MRPSRSCSTAASHDARTAWPSAVSVYVRFVGPDRAIAVVVTANRPRLAEVTATGTVTDVTPAVGLKSLQAGYLGWSPGRPVM